MASESTTHRQQQEQQQEENNNNSTTSLSPTPRSVSPVRRRPRSRPRHNEEGSSERSTDKEVELALNWLYTRDSTIKDAKYFVKLHKMIPLSKQNCDYEDRAHEIADTLGWMRQRKRERNMMQNSCNTTMTI